MSSHDSQFKHIAKKISEPVKQSINKLNKWRVLPTIRVSSKAIWNLFLIFVVVMMMGFVFAGAAGAGYFASLVKDQQPLSKQEMKSYIYHYTETSDIYLANGKYLGQIDSKVHRETVKLDQVSQHFINALVATEDKFYFKHEGVVPKAVFRALYQELSNAPIVTGGSTLTQQLIKNQILSSKVTFERKAKEMLYAVRLENFFSKKEILRAYVNFVSFGRNAAGQNIAGIQAAAQGVFGVDASQLSIPQAAFLAGMPQNPFRYTPYTNTGAIKDDLSAGLARMQTVLERMKENDYITPKQYKQAMNYNIRKHLREPWEPAQEQYTVLTRYIKQAATKQLAIQIANNKGYNGHKLFKKRIDTINFYMNKAIQQSVLITLTGKKTSINFIKQHKNIKHSNKKPKINC